MNCPLGVKYVANSKGPRCLDFTSEAWPKYVSLFDLVLGDPPKDDDPMSDANAERLARELLMKTRARTQAFDAVCLAILY